MRKNAKKNGEKWGNIRIKTWFKFLRSDSYKKLFLVRKKDEKWGNISMKIRLKNSKKWVNMRKKIEINFRF